MPDAVIGPKAKGHTRIVLDVRLLAREIRTDWDVYMATYTATAGYQLAEEQSGQEFWSITAFSGEPSRASHVKNLDVIIVQDDRVKFMIEVKWGALPTLSETDLLINPKELNKMVKLMAAPAICRVNGPVVSKGQRRRSGNYPAKGNFPTDKDAKLILVSDFQLAKTAIPSKFVQFRALAARMKGTFQPADIKSRVGEIPSLREILEAS